MERLSVSRWLAAGAVGGIVFWSFQVLTGPRTIPQFMGQQIVSLGGYPESLTVPIGWGVHLGVSLSYALLYSIVMLIPFSHSRAGRIVAGLVIGAVLGWITTLLTSPAIAVTISVLSGKGFPASLPGLNTAYGLPFWNHMLFFAVVWFLYTAIPRGRR
jgi:hypothetical protein